MNFIRIALAGTLLLAGTAATAQTVNDAQCIILSNVFAKEFEGTAAAEGRRSCSLFLPWPRPGRNDLGSAQGPVRPGVEAFDRRDHRSEDE